jgi:hypothetical protein
VQAYVQPLPGPGPTSSWTAKEVVLGFLHASASYAFDPAAARRYLAPGLRKIWHPGRGPVAVVGGPTVLTDELYHPHDVALAESSEQVDFTGQHLATLSQSGQYQYASGANVQYQFVLARTDGVWLIQALPPQQSLLLTESDFEEVYQPRNLFFFAPAPASQVPDVLVPDPVYAPLQSSNSALNTDVATGLVNGLLEGQGLLSDTTFSAFPRGTRLLKRVTIIGKTAQVYLGGAAAHSQQSTIQQMADQLLATLSDGQYSQPLARSLQLYIDNKPQAVYPAGNLVPVVQSGAVQLITGAGSVGELPAQPEHGDKVQTRLGPDQLGTATVTAVAASPSSGPHPAQLAVAIQNAGGCAVEEQPTGQGAYRTDALTSSGGPCNSLSYDINGNLWAAVADAVWVLGPGRSPAPADMSAMAAAIQPGDQILALRLAPDAVRAALLVSTPAGNRLLLAAVHVRNGIATFGQPVTVGTAGLTDPLAISWYDAYHLAVLAAGAIYEVPLTGGAGQQPAPQLISTLPTSVQTLTMTTDGTELVVGTSQGVYAEAVSLPGWSFIANGADPVYPG